MSLAVEAAFFWPNVDKVGGPVHPVEGQCWIWRGSSESSGYGRFTLDGKSVLAHRFSWLLSHGVLPPGWMVCHRCDTPACVRPWHLFLGTAADNADDMVRKGRSTRGRRRDPAPFTRAVQVAS